MSERTFERIVILFRVGYTNGHLVLHFDNGLLTFISLMLNGVQFYWEYNMNCLYLYMPDCCYVSIGCGNEYVDTLLSIVERLIGYVYDISEPIFES